MGHLHRSVRAGAKACLCGRNRQSEIIRLMRALIKRYVLMTLCVLLLLAALVLVSQILLVRHPVNATVSRCTLNLNAIAQAKFAWMNDNNKTTNDVPTWNDLLPYTEFFG